MNIELLRADVEKAAYEADLDLEEDLRFDYSGRGMYGGKCFGIVADTARYTKFMMLLFADLDRDQAWEMVDQVCTDSMGFDTIFYFPGVFVVDEED